MIGFDFLAYVTCVTEGLDLLPHTGPIEVGLESEVHSSWSGMRCLEGSVMGLF